MTALLKSLLGAINNLFLMESVWDPNRSSYWDKATPNPQCLLRIKRDITSILEQPPPGMFIVPDKNDKTLIHALITGPFDTPYEGGFFYFLVRCPPDYPIHPPQVKLMTTAGGRVRFNPNFYKNGKVCLSILGTSRGPRWKPAQTLESVLLSLQSLMNEKPYYNEPGFRMEKIPGDSKRYNEFIIHETLRVAVCDMLEGNTKDTKGCPQAFREIMERLFPEFCDLYVTVVKDKMHLTGHTMVDPFEEPRGHFNFTSIFRRLEAIKSNLSKKAAAAATEKIYIRFLEEIKEGEREYLTVVAHQPLFKPNGEINNLESWWDPTKSSDWDKATPSPKSLLRIKRDIKSILEQPPPGIFIAPDDNDMTLIHALITGPFDTPYEGGFFYFLVRCPPDYPFHPPQVKLMTTAGGRVRFNPSFYKNGRVFLSILGTWHGPQWTPSQTLETVLLSLQSLMNEKPYYSASGFNEERRPGDSQRYNDVIVHETLRVAVCDMLEGRTDDTKGCPQAFRDLMEQSFPEFFDYYITAVKNKMHMTGRTMVDPFGKPRRCFDFKSIFHRLKAIKSNLSKKAAAAAATVTP